MSDLLALTFALPDLALTLSLQGSLTFSCSGGNPSSLPRDQFDPFVTLILYLIS